MEGEKTVNRKEKSSSKALGRKEGRRIGVEKNKVSQREGWKEGEQ